MLRRRGFVPLGIDRGGTEPDCLGEVPRLPFADASFSLVVCTSVLHYLEDPPAACKEIRRLLEPEGTAVIVVPCCLPLDPTDRWRWTDFALDRMVQDAGFDRIEVAPILPTMANLLHLLALSVRKAVPLFGAPIAAVLDAVARAGLRSKDARLAGGYAVRARKPA